MGWGGGRGAPVAGAGAEVAAVPSSPPLLSRSLSLTFDRPPLPPPPLTPTQERPFDTEAVGDLVHLRGVLSLTDEDVAGALAERSRRIRAKMGPVLFATEGLTSEGIARKAALRGYVGKLMWLADDEALLDQTSAVRDRLNVPLEFGMRDAHDVERVRIATLADGPDLGKLEEMIASGEVASGGEDGGATGSEGEGV